MTKITRKSLERVARMIIAIDGDNGQAVRLARRARAVLRDPKRHGSLERRILRARQLLDSALLKISPRAEAELDFVQEVVNRIRQAELGGR